MNKLLTLILLAMIIACTPATKTNTVVDDTKEAGTFDVDYVKERTTYFEVADGSLTGEGTEVIDKIFRESQFVLFGERHNSKPTSKLMSAIIPVMNKHQFNTMALEVGPHSVKKLIEFMTPAHETVDKLKAFNSKHYKTIKEGPIPFFSGVEDAEFLAKAAEYEMELWGLDQEYYYSVLIQNEQLLEAVKEEANYAELKSLKEKADKAALDWFKTDHDQDIELFQSLANDPAIRSYFDAVKDISSETIQILEDLMISWDIYNNWRNDSHSDRVSYMRNNFIRNYEAKSKLSGAPKVFLKFGGLHTAQILSNDVFDIGHQLNEMASGKNQVCTNITCFSRYYLRDGEESDVLSNTRRAVQRYKYFYELSDRNSWAIIDLASMRSDIADKTMVLPTDGDFHTIKGLIEGYDYLFMLPQDQYITENVFDELLE